MAITAALSPLDINLPPPTRTSGAASTNTDEGRLKRTTTTASSKPRKQSDYHLIQKLTAKITGQPKPSYDAEPAPKPPTTSKTPVKKARSSKKILCATPPVNLHNRKRNVNYDRGRQLGEGGFARCYLVQNQEGKLFAAKTVAKESLLSEKMQAKFFGEIQVQKTMVHPNIVRFVECFEDTRNIYLILELCPNKSLVDMLRRRGRFTEPEARFFMLQILGALKYMHGKRVIHRDLKLGNIFLDEAMNVKIGDFGLAALLVSDTDRKTTMCGTPNYIAPEVLFGKKVGHSFEVDLWSCGVILYAMLVGKPPFQANDINAIYKKIRDSSFEWPSNIPVSDEAKALITALLNKDPNSRPSLDTIADHAFFRTGYFPKSIPQTATLKEPVFKTASGATINNFSPSSTAQAESRRNYIEVAKNAGIGMDEYGRPMECVGDDVGRPVSALQMERSAEPEPEPAPAPAPVRARSRRGEAAAPPPPPVRSSREKQKQNQAEVEEFVMKIMDPVVMVEPRQSRQKRTEEPQPQQQQQQQPSAQLQQEKQERQAKKTREYLLPEALSPRDGRARMRNTALLRSSAAVPPRRPSALGPARSGAVTDLTAAPGIPQGTRKASSRLGQQRGVVEEVEVVEESSSEEEVDEPQPEPEPPARPRRPQRGAASTGVGGGDRDRAPGIPASKIVPPKLPDVFPPRRPTRSSAAEARERAASTPIEEPVQPPPLLPTSRRAAGTTRRTTALRTTTTTAATTSSAPAPPRPTTPTHQRTSTNLSTHSALSTGTTASGSSSTPIPTTPSLSTSIGQPLPYTTTTSILSSLTSIITALTSILTTSPPPPANPAQTTHAIREWKRGERNKCVFITKWVDYTNKYGIGYTLTDGSCGTMFNDNTGLVCVTSLPATSPEAGTKDGADIAWYISQGHMNSTSTHPGSKHTRTPTSGGPGVVETVYKAIPTTITQLQKERTAAAVRRRYGDNLASASVESGVLAKIAPGEQRLAENKVAMWKRFGTYMKESLEGGNEFDFTPSSSSSSSGGGAGFGTAGSGRELIFVTTYARLKSGAFFRFSNGDLQFNFSDHTKLIVSDSGRTLRFLGQGRKMYVMGVAEVWRIVNSAEAGIGEEALTRWEKEVRDAGVKEKVAFVRGFLRGWWREGKIPGVRRKVGEKLGNGERERERDDVVVLGEAV